MTNYRRGTNQYAKKGKRDIGAYMIGFIYLMSLMVLMYDISLHVPSQSEASENIGAPVGITQSALPESKQVVAIKVATPAGILKPEPKPTEEILDYINTIFRKDAKVAIAVMKNECNPQNKLFPSCHKTITSKEYSVGIFQINIQSATSKVHYNRIPGETLEEKVEWLKDPFNNTLMAYWIFQNSGWYPWTAYTSGNYLKDM